MNWSNCKNAKAETVNKLEARISRPNFIPESFYSKPEFSYGSVMEEHDSTIAQRWKPRLEVVPDCVVGMEPVNVQHIDRPVAETLPRIVESRSNQLGEIAV